jgi:hypothetical protein
MAIEIRLLQDHELQLANNFFNRIYQTTRPFENFLWEFVNGPNGKAIYVVAVDTSEKKETRIVGIQCAIPLELISNKGKVVLTAKSEDTLVDPSYRGQKIFEKMYDVLFAESRKAGIKYIWGFTPALKAFERIGFEAPFKATQALLAFNALKSYDFLKELNPQNKTIDKLKIFGLSALSWIKGLTSDPTGKSTIEMQEATTENKANLVASFYSEGPEYFFLHETDEYLRWRLGENPFKNNYQTLVYKKNNHIVADILINFRSNVSYIEQMLFSKEVSYEEQKLIVKQVVTKMRSAGTPLIRALCFETNEETNAFIELLKESGFTYLQRGNYFVWKALTDDGVIRPTQLFLNRLFTQGNL